jgi:GTPase SAR1 family protein
MKKNLGTIGIVGTNNLLESLVSGEYVKESIRIYKDNKEIFELADNCIYDKPTKKQMNQIVIPVRTEPKYQNNEPCPCLSGKKYKKCCKASI